MGLLISEVYCERKPCPTEDCPTNYKLVAFGETEPYEPFTDDIGKLFRSLQKEYGRCESQVYADLPDRKVLAHGWVFVKRMRYEDARGHEPTDYYIREVWVRLHTAPDTVTREPHYFDLEAKMFPANFAHVAQATKGA